MIVDSSQEHHQDDIYQMDASKDGRLAALGMIYQQQIRLIRWTLERMIAKQ